MLAFNKFDSFASLPKLNWLNIMAIVGHNKTNFASFEIGLKKPSKFVASVSRKGFCWQINQESLQSTQWTIDV